MPTKEDKDIGKADRQRPPDVFIHFPAAELSETPIQPDSDIG